MPSGLQITFSEEKDWTNDIKIGKKLLGEYVSSGEKLPGNIPKQRKVITRKEEIPGKD